MKTNIVSRFVIVLTAVMMTSCAPNVLNIQKGAIFGEGRTSYPPLRGGEKIHSLDINPQKMSHADQTNLWVELPDGEKVSFAAMTRAKIKSHAIWETKDPRSNSDEKADYFAGSYNFRFDGETLFNLHIVDQGWQTHYAKGFPKIGSFSSNHFLILPCTLKEFEEVFGKPNQIDRKWVN
jgi:hypothetical protein